MKNKLLLVLLSCISYSLQAQKLPENWYNLDFKTDSVYGVSANKALEYLKGKPSTKVIVAIIDDGGDIDHQDLKQHVWVNSNEVDSNNVDDDKNGYIDDVNGWNFLGNSSESISYDNLEVTRVYRKWNSVFIDSMAAIEYPSEYKDYLFAKTKFEKEFAAATKTDARLKNVLLWMDSMEKSIGKKRDSITVTDIRNYILQDSLLAKNKDRLITALNAGLSFSDVADDVISSYNRNKEKLDYHYNINYDCRKIIADDYDNVNDRNYGNNKVKSPEGSHGTHVGGIVGAIRGNDIGVDGVAETASLMFLRVVPNGDERDKDIANAIRYAAENGAKIINMSFGKPLPYNKPAVDDAVKFAISKDVLIVHAAGNEALNLDVDRRFPNPNYKDNSGNAWSNWLDVGANAADGSPGVFSNYGENYVDLFAPGVKINSTLPNNEYGLRNGTSMAAPVAAGVAAILRAYFPSLTAQEIKLIMSKSVIKQKAKVIKPGTKDELVKWNSLSKTGGILNAYSAVLLAEKKASKKRK
jgi:subtilisin family serine protease